MKLYYNPEDPKKDPNTKEVVHTLQGDNVREETKDQREKLKNKPLKDKIKYYVGYYKFHVLGIGLAIFVVFSLFYAFFTHKDYSFYGMMINSTNIDNEKLTASFKEYLENDIKEHPENYTTPKEGEDDLLIFLDTTSISSKAGNGDFDLGTDQKITTLVAVSDLDFMMFDSIAFRRKTYNDLFYDLSKILSPEDYEKYKDKFYYIDAAVYERLAAKEEITGGVELEPAPPETLEETYEELAKHTDPSSMERPVPVGIILDEAPIVKKMECYYGNVPVFGIVVNTLRPDYAIAYLHFMNDDSIDFTSMRSMF